MVPKVGPTGWLMAHAGHLLLLVATAALFWVAYDDGSYGLASRTTLGIVVWWILILGIALRLLELPSSRWSLLPVALLGAFAAWTLISVTWSSNDEATFDEFNRVTLYLGILILASLVRSPPARERFVDGLTLAVTGIALVALTSRLFPGALPERSLADFLPAVATRLSFPLGYWNGIAIFVALGIPLLLRMSIVANALVVRAAAVAVLPIFGCVIYLASSRGGVATGVVGAACFVAFTARRWTAVAALVAGGLGTAASVAVLLDRQQLVNGPLGGSAAHDQGRSAAVLIAMLSIGAGVVFAVAARFLGSRRLRLPAPRAITAVLCVLLAVAIILAHPVRRFEEFRALPQQPLAANDFARAHLTSGSGSGRWQFWTSAFDEWKRHPVAGGGAGSYEQWWAQHASFSYFVKNAHSLYLETLGELGLVGFGFLALFVLASVVLGARALRHGSTDSRATDSALLALFVAFLVAAGVDWMWQLTAVTALSMFALGLLLASSPSAVQAAAGSERQSAAARAVLIAAGVAVIVAAAIPMLAQLQIGSSQAAVARGDLQAATTDALRARAIQPWAASPYLQLALAAELDGRLPDARRWIQSAIRRDENDWRLWIVAARIETKLAMPRSASASLRRAETLNPRSPLFVGIRGKSG
jgi:hypothetical protein